MAYSTKFLRLSLVLPFFLFMGISSSLAENRVVKVGVYENAPKVFISEDGRPSGIFVDIIEFIAEREGWNLKYVPGTWAEGLERLAGGEIDLMPDVAYTAERGKRFSFHRVQVLSSWFQAYARRNSGIKSILDLNGKRVALLEKSVQQEAFIRFSHGFGLNIDLVSVPDFKTMFEIVANGQADAAITNQFYGAMHARKYGLEDTAVVFEPSALFFAAARGAHEPLLNTIDKYLEDIKKDPQSVYYRSMKRWTSEEVRFELPAWIYTAALVAGLVLLMSLGGSIVLKHQVDVRTRELRKINEEMEQRIIARTAELAEAMERAQVADKLKSAFLATMSHELRTPLNSIIGFTGIILQGIVGPLNEEQKKQLNIVRGSAQHLLSLINDVLDVSKIEAGQMKISCEEYDLPSAIDKAVGSARPMAEKKGLELGCVISPEVGIVNGDRRRVEQVLLNLISNAVKFTEKGSVKVECEREGDAVTVRVVDTGIGIKPEDMETLFKDFRQIDSGMTRKYDGTGLGLSISKRLVELMGGSIRATSVWGAGSTFIFTLPKERKEA